MTKKPHLTIPYVTLLGRLIDKAHKLDALPPLSPVEKARLDSSRDIEHLYYSSKIEGTILTHKQLDSAIYG